MQGNHSKGHKKAEKKECLCGLVGSQLEQQYFGWKIKGISKKKGDKQRFIHKVQWTKTSKLYKGTIKCNLEGQA